MKILLNIPGFSDTETQALNGLLTQLNGVRERNSMREIRYQSKNMVKLVGGVIPPQYLQLALVLGWEAKAVDMLHQRCRLDRFVWPDGDIDSLGVRELWKSNFLGSEIASAQISSLIYGTSFLMTTIGSEADGEPPVLIHARDGLSTTGFWNSRARRLEALLAVDAWDDQQKPVHFRLYLPNLVIEAQKNGGKWSVDRFPHIYWVPAEPMVFKPRAGRPFGSSRISRPIMSIADSAIRTIIRLEGHSDVYSWPEMWLLGGNEDMFRNPDGTMKEAWRIRLALLKVVPDDDSAVNPRAEIKQFPAASPQPHLLTLKQQAQLFSGEAAIPLTSLGVSDMSNPTSADSYIASREDLIAQAENATDDWSPFLERTMLRALTILHRQTEPDPAWRSIDTKWRSPIYVSRAAAADAGMKQLAAVPDLADSEVGLELVGLTESQITRVLADRRRNSGRQLLNALREAGASTS